MILPVMHVFSSCLLRGTVPDLTRNRNLYNTQNNCGMSFQPNSGFGTRNHHWD